MAEPIKPLRIEDPEAYRLARALADSSGETIMRVVVSALRERLERERRKQRRQLLIEEMKEIAERVKSLPVRDRRSADEIIGYNDIGVFG
jgi:antitoxin VapB